MSETKMFSVLAVEDLDRMFHLAALYMEYNLNKNLKKHNTSFTPSGMAHTLYLCATIIFSFIPCWNESFLAGIS